MTDQDHNEAKDESGVTWIESLRGHLGAALAVSAALDDVAVACGNDVDATWIDMRQEADIGVYVLAAGVLHRVIGPSDAALDPSAPDDPAVTTVEYRAARIGPHASYKVEVRREVRPHNPLGHEPAALARTWTFTELGEFRSLNMQWPVREAWPRPHDPTAFAGALTRAILAASEYES